MEKFPEHNLITAKEIEILNKYSNKPTAHITDGNPECGQCVGVSYDPEHGRGTHPAQVISKRGVECHCAFPLGKSDVRKRESAHPRFSCTEVSLFCTQASILVLS